jgi:serine/threonine protein kinase
MLTKSIRGRTLDHLLPEKPRHGSLLTLFETVCQALAYAHRRGIVHRDLEPANVMFGAFGEILLLDWGLALEMQKDASETVTAENARHAALLANPAYMAPEQARGESTDYRADVFGLGAILCHMLTGAPPFRGENTASMLKMAATADLADANSRLQRCEAIKELIALAAQCLRPQRDDRPADASEVAGRVAMIRRES